MSAIIETLLEGAQYIRQLGKMPIRSIIPMVDFISDFVTDLILFVEITVVHKLL